MGKAGRPPKPDGDEEESHNNVMGLSGDDERPKTRQGNARSYALDRLHRERPDLHERVENEDMSANAAMIEAG